MHITKAAEYAGSNENDGGAYGNGSEEAHHDHVGDEQWQELHDDGGHAYYFNTHSGVSQW
jgi:hypothetical protein